MTIYDILDKLKQPSLWLNDEAWAQWGLVAIAASLSFLLLVLVVRRRRRRLAAAAMGGYSLEGPLAGNVQLSDAHPGGGGAETYPKDESWTATAAQSKWADTPIRLLRREIIKRDQNEARLERELAGLRAANEQLRKRVAQAREMSDLLREKIAELTETQSRPPERESEPGPADAKQEKPAHKKSPSGAKTEQKQCRRCKKKKAPGEFHKNASSSDGLSRWCKACKREAQRKYRQQRTSRQPSGVCVDAPLCVLHHRQADRIKRARRRRPRDVDQSSGRIRRFRSPLSSPGLHCPKK